MGLADAACNGRLDDTSRLRVEELIRSGPDPARLYVQYLDMHASLRWLTARPDDVKADRQSAAATTNTTHAGKPVWKRSVQYWAKFVDTHGLLVLAASVLVAMATFWAGRAWQTERVGVADVHSNMQDADLPMAASRIVPVVARVTGLVDYRSPNSPQQLRFGKPLVGGELVQLDEGLVQLTFSSGAKVIVQGPAGSESSALHATMQISYFFSTCYS